MIQSRYDLTGCTIEPTAQALLDAMHQTANRLGCSVHAVVPVTFVPHGTTSVLGPGRHDQVGFAEHELRLCGRIRLPRNGIQRPIPWRRCRPARDRCCWRAGVPRAGRLRWQQVRRPGAGRTCETTSVSAQVRSMARSATLASTEALDNSSASPSRHLRLYAVGPAYVIWRSVYLPTCRPVWSKCETRPWLLRLHVPDQRGE